MRKANISLAFIALVILAGFTFIGIKGGVAANRELNFSAPKLQSTEAKLKSVNIKQEKLNSELNSKSSKDQQTIDQLNKQKQDLEKQREDLNQQLQSRIEQKAKLAQAAIDASNTLTLTSTASAQSIPYVSSGSHEDWMTQAGIPQEYWWAVDYIVSRESGWNPCAYNPGQSDCTTDFVPGTACGLVQTLPCGKAGDNWRDPVAALRWQYSYVTGKFGGYPQAVTYWQSHSNY